MLAETQHGLTVGAVAITSDAQHVPLSSLGTNPPGSVSRVGTNVSRNSPIRSHDGVASSVDSLAQLEGAQKVEGSQATPAS